MKKNWKQWMRERGGEKEWEREREGGIVYHCISIQLKICGGIF